MQINPSTDNERSRFADTSISYGWVSIVLHWLTATVVIALWFLGQSIDSAEAGNVATRRTLHVSVAASAWLVVLLRILWRFRAGHPKVRGLTERTHRIAMWTHYLMLFLLALMLLSGPLAVWATGQAIVIFETLVIPSPITVSDELQEFARTVHSISARGLFLLVLIHIGAALKHLMFHTDDSIVRMLWPPRNIEHGVNK